MVSRIVKSLKKPTKIFGIYIHLQRYLRFMAAKHIGLDHTGPRI